MAETYILSLPAIFSIVIYVIEYQPQQFSCQLQSLHEGQLYVHQYPVNELRSQWTYLYIYQAAILHFYGDRTVK